MPKFDSVRTVQYTRNQMFDLIMDIEKYPLFLPLCESLVIKSRKERDGQILLVASMTAGYKTIKETLTSQVHADVINKTINVQYLDGPFKYLHNNWTFSPVNENECEVGFKIDYEFKSRMLGMVMGSMFDLAFRRFSQAFEERAALIYGKPKGLV